MRGVIFLTVKDMALSWNLPHDSGSRRRRLDQ
jgi:hypothetical protein